MNKSTKDILKNSLTATVGLFLFSFGVYMTIQANIGVAPWDAFNLGMSSTFGVTYGTANILASLVIVAIDILLKERIGIGMFLDAILVGEFVDLFNWIGLIPLQNKLVWSLVLMTAGMFVMGFAQYFYMKAALGCGPRDTLLVGLKRKISKMPIGIISTIILAAVTLAGWLLGGPIGIGTLICAFLTGPIMQLMFRVVSFDATAVEHQNILTSFKIILGKKESPDRDIKVR